MADIYKRWTEVVGAELMERFRDMGTYHAREVYVSGGSISAGPATSGGLDIYRNIDLDETGVVAKSSAGQVFGWYLFNAATSTRYVKVYNKASAPASTDTPAMTIPIPAGSAANVEFGNGIEFGVGIGLRATTGVADNDTGAPSANDVIVNILYK